MKKIKAVLIKPLDGHPAGALLSFDEPDFKRLISQGAVRAMPQSRKAPANLLPKVPKPRPTA